MQRLLSYLIATSLVLLLPVVSNAGGHCTFAQQGPAQSYEACEMPVDESACTAIGEDPRNSDAEYGSGACPVDGVVGTCDKGASKLYYYSGVPEQLEVGCGFQGGTWINQ